MGIIYSDYELFISEVAEELIKLWEILEEFEEARKLLNKNICSRNKVHAK